MNAAMQIPRKAGELKGSCLRNAYQVNPATEYNPGKSPRHVYDMKMYAELRQKRKTKKYRIKSRYDNKTDSGSETLSVTDNENFCAATVDWCQLYASVNISGLDKRKNNGAEQVIDFVASKVKNAEKTMAALLSTGLYSDGTDAKSIVGLRDWVATDQTVGGLSQTTFTWWAGQVDSSTTTLTMSAMQTLYHNCVLNNNQPTVAVATKANYNRYYALLQPQQRFVDTQSAKGGWTTLMFNGIPLIADTSVPANHLFFLNEEFLHLFYHPECDMLFTGFKEPINQDVEAGQVLWQGAFGSNNNRMHGKFSALTA